ncbi:respiratory nitrate reductase 2 alpha chain [Escherichia coli]|nr:respiratory nitrate reductase 2 alpha chain [Escherichia coli]
MSKLLDRFRYFKQKGETFADGHGQVMHSNRDWGGQLSPALAVRQNRAFHPRC